ncbi:MAG: YggS family pyridoxal phosphate-dependent enzyme [Candidatus Omnitrophota bacterium]
MIKDNVLEARRRIQAACLRVKLDPAAVKLVAVSKNRSIEQIKEAIFAGITDFGENRVKEAVVKHRELSATSHQPLAIKWHMVGHLQANKVKEAVRIFDLIHSVDSLRLIEEIDKQAARINKIQDILVEVKTSPEATKSGIEPLQAAGVIKAAAKFKNVNVQGLMTIAPAVDNPEEARKYFRELSQLRGKIDPSFILSMGMSDDFEIAVEEGSNVIRIGRAIFQGGL